MNWTTEKPTKPGWYFYRGTFTVHPCDAEVIKVFPSMMAYVATQDEYFNLSDLSGQFAGPISEPTEATPI